MEVIRSTGLRISTGDHPDHDTAVATVVPVSGVRTVDTSPLGTLSGSRTLPAPPRRPVGLAVVAAPAVAVIPMKLAIAILLCAFGVATAQPAKDKAAAAYAEGQRRYNAGEYRPAAAKFLEAYGHDADPAYLFNIAQSYRFAHDCAQAARYYRRFLAAVASAPNRAKVRGYLDEMDACVRREAKPPPAEPPTPTATSTKNPAAAPTKPLPPPISGYAVGTAGFAV